MPTGDLSAETILIVDDEEPVRRTFREWLEGADLGCRILAAADAESALLQANQHTIDLAILDWNLGAGNDGLQLLEDLALFNPDVVAIMITGFAHQATPLDAMRMGVRDYLDKNQDLDRDTFLRAVRRQLDRIRPARRERRLHQGLVAFRAAVEKVLPLVQAAAALQRSGAAAGRDPQPVPLPAAHHRRPRRRAAGAQLRRRPRPGGSLPRLRRRRPAARRGRWCRSRARVAGGVVSLQRAVRHDAARSRRRRGVASSCTRSSSGRRSLLAAPLNVAPGLQVVLELFDKQAQAANWTRPASPRTTAGWRRRRPTSAPRCCGRRWRNGRRSACCSTPWRRRWGRAIRWPSRCAAAAARPDEPPPAAVLERLREGLRRRRRRRSTPTRRCGWPRRCACWRCGTARPRCATASRLVESLRALLDEVAGVEGDRCR